MTPMDWSAVSSLSGYVIPMATNKDLLAYLDVSSGSAVMAIRRRDSEGQYQHVANITEVSSLFFATNGKWIMSAGSPSVLFSIDANNKLSNASFIAATVGGFLLSDDTFVGYDPVSENGDGNYTFRSFEYNAANNNWTEIAGTKLVVPTSVMFNGDYSTYRVSDTHLVFLDILTPDNFTAQIYKRQANKSWSFFDSVPVNSSSTGSVNFNGVDTLVYSLPMNTEDGVAGIVFIHTKINGQWIRQKFNGANLGYRPLGIIGYTTIFANPNTLFVSAGAEGYTGSISGGKVLMLTRNAEGLWEPSIDLIGNGGLVGLGFGINDYDIVAGSVTSTDLGISIRFLSGPLCFTQPINVTCSNQQVNDCSDVEITELYTVNNPQCGAITANLNGFSLVNNQAISAEFTFTRGYGADFSCNATVTCPAPPVAANNNVNSAIVLQLSLASLLVSAAVLFL
jgi:hypothetical protein